MKNVLVYNLVYFRDLQVWKMFDYNPVLWEVMEILAPSKNIFLCKQIFRNYIFIGTVKPA